MVKPLRPIKFCDEVPVPFSYDSTLLKGPMYQR